MTTSARLAALAASIGAAHSYPEAMHALDELGGIGAAAFATYQKLLASPGLHPEVRFYVLRDALGNPAPEAVLLAAQELTGDDKDLRLFAAKALSAHGDKRVVDALLAAIPKETQLIVQAEEIVALGTTGSKQVIPVLEEYLGAAYPAMIVSCAAESLGRLHAASSAPLIVAALRPEFSQSTVDTMLRAVHNSLGSPDYAHLLRIARDEGSPIRAFAIKQMADTLPTRSDPHFQEQAREVKAVALGALGDKRPLTRAKALFALSMSERGPFDYIADPDALAPLLEGLADPNPEVRLAGLTALHNTIMRRGIMTPSLPPTPISPETMRMLRWPTDWRIFPRLVDLLDDPEPAVREKAIWLLGISTGYWYGYDDIRLLGAARITPEAKAGYAAMWNTMKEHSPRELTTAILDRTIQALAAGAEPQLHGDWMRGVGLLSGTTMGYRTNASAEERAKALSALAGWWKLNRDRHPAEWLHDAVLRTGMSPLSEVYLSMLGRWTREPIPPGLLDYDKRSANPQALLQEFASWWQRARESLR